jgi:hypothetical protein
MNAEMRGSEPTTFENDGERGWSPWRIAGWSFAALLLLLPAVAMQFTDEVNWTVSDFIFAAVLILSVGIPLELVARKTGNLWYRAAVLFALAAAFLLVWINGAVGIIGSENNDANVMFGAVLAVAFVGSIIARMRPLGMTVVMIAAACAQLTVAVIAILGRFHDPGSEMQLLGITGMFVTLWCASAALFWQAADADREGPASA